MNAAAFAASSFLLALPHAALAAQPDRPPVRYTPLVLSGQVAPGFDQPFRHFPYHSFLNDSDQTLFFGSTSAWPGSSPEGLFLADRKSISLIARTGQPVPGTLEGVTIESFDINFQRVNDAGQAIFETTLAGPGIDSSGYTEGNRYAICVATDGQLQKVARSGDPAPGVDGAYSWPTRAALGGNGNVSFASYLAGPAITEGNNQIFWYGRPGALVVLAREGDLAPGAGSAHFAGGSFWPVLSRNGEHVAFMMDLDGGEPYREQGGLWVGQPGNLRLVARLASPDPVTGSPFRTFGRHTELGINNSGDVIFNAGTQKAFAGLYYTSRGELKLLAQTGDPAPGIDGGVYSFFYEAHLNDRGDVVFRTDADPTDQYIHAIYAGKPNRLKLIAYQGMHAPGTEKGVIFSDVIESIINKDGQVAFFGYLAGPGSRGENDYGVFATGHSGDLRLIARYGDEFEVAPGDTRTIQAVSYAGVYGSHVLSFNADSDLSLFIRFTDGSEGLFNVRVLPEPSALALLIATPMLLRRRR